jgi:GAF domain-containing protein
MHITSRWHAEALRLAVSASKAASIGGLFRFESHHRAQAGHSLACGLAAATRHPVITPDVMADASWSKWRWLAKAFGYRGCWSFPIETRDGNIVGTFAMYHKEPTDAKTRDLDLAAVLTCAAAGFIERRMTVAG